MKFVWHMTEENWKNMMHDLEASKYDDLSDNYGFYGQMFAGDYCVEFIALTDWENGEEVGHFSYTEIYQLFVDDMFDTDENGNQYILTDYHINTPDNAKNFDEFKKLCEKEFVSIIGTESVKSTRKM